MHTRPGQTLWLEASWLFSEDSLCAQRGWQLPRRQQDGRGTGEVGTAQSLLIQSHVTLVLVNFWLPHPPSFHHCSPTPPAPTVASVDQGSQIGAHRWLSCCGHLALLFLPNLSHSRLQKADRSRREDFFSPVVGVPLICILHASKAVTSS